MFRELIRNFPSNYKASVKLFNNKKYKNKNKRNINVEDTEVAEKKL